MSTAQSNLTVTFEQPCGRNTARVHALAVALGIGKVKEYSKKSHNMVWQSDADIEQRFVSIDALDPEINEFDTDE